MKADAKQREFLSAVERNRRPDGTINKVGVARELGVARQSVQRRIQSIESEERANRPRKFEAPSLPHRTRQIDELIADRIRESERVIGADEARDLIPIKVNLDGPFGLLVFGDPHIDDPGCAFALLKSHIELAQRHDHILAANIGDLANNWVGRLARLYSSQSTTDRESWTLVEWMVKSVNWLFIIAGNHDCLDMQTEALTRRGWVFFDDIRDDDQIMSFVPETGEWEWSPILAKIDREHDGEFVNVSGSPVDMRVTKNHRVLHRKYSSYQNVYGDFTYCKAGDLPQKFSIPVSASRSAKELDIADDWLTVAGWLLTDGSIKKPESENHRRRITFYQSKECPSLEAALRNLNIDHSVAIRNRRIESVCGRLLVADPKPQREYRLGVDQSERVLSVIPEKGRLPDWAFALSDRQFSVLLDAIVEGDGTWDGARPDLKKCAVVHGTKEFLDSLQICAIQHGWRAHISAAREKDYRLNLCRKTEWQAHRYASVRSESGKERVWCLSVPHTNFMVRRNGKPFFTGNCWTGAGDPVSWFAKQAGSMYEEHGVRLELQHPGGAKTRIHARHDFPGHSIWNSMHGPKRELVAGFRDHVLVAGHKHIGGDEGTISPDGICAQLVRVSGYKLADTYARQLGLKKMPIHPAALIIIDPREPENSRARAWCAPTVELGVKLLDSIRREYESGGQRLCIAEEDLIPTSGKKRR